MIICILEYPEDDQAQTWFMDTAKLDATNITHIAYKKAVDEALTNSMHMSAVDCDTAFFYSGHEEMKSCSAETPCYVDANVTIYLE